MPLKSKIGKVVGEYLILTLACFIFAFAWEGFMIPNGMSAGGMMGLCTVIQYATGGLIQAEYSYFVINALLIIVAVLVMGLGFGFRTIYCIVVSSAAMAIVGDIQALKCIPGEFFYVNEKLLIPVIAGALEAVGIGLTLRKGGSTGGTDIIALMVNKYWPVSLSKAFVVSDLSIVALLLLLPDKVFADVVYGVVEIIVFSLIIDMVVGGKKSSYQLLVFSSRYEEIADHVTRDMDRGVTVLKAQGWYTKADRQVLMILVSQKEYPALSRYIKELDPRAFVSVTNAGGVYGEGFDEIKTGIRKKKTR